MLDLGIIKNKIEQLGISPIYFIGSGISRRYFDAPDFKGLLSMIRNDWDRSFEHYLQKHGRVYPLLAQELSDMYFDKLNDSDLESGKDRDYYFKRRVSIILQSLFEAQTYDFEGKLEVTLLKQTSPSAIITTNYDTFLEYCFPLYEPYVGQESLLSQNVSAVGEIYKIHGCLNYPDSIVITQKDYDNFSEKQRYINAKLMTLFLEYPIVILGYSLEDDNIKNILADIVKMLPAEKVKELADRIFFIKRNTGTEDYNKLERFSLNDGLYIDLPVFYLKDYSLLYQTIISTKVQKLPINFLRYLKSNIYRLTASQEYNPKLLDVNIVDLEKVENFDSVHNMIGLTFVTTQKGAKDLLENKDIVLPVIRQETQCAYIDAAIKYLVKENKSHLPLHYYKQLKGGEDRFVEWLDQQNDVKSDNKEAIYGKLRSYKNYSTVMGRDFYFNKDDLNNIQLEIAAIQEYHNEYCVRNEVVTTSHTTVLKYLILNLCLFRLEDILKNDGFIGSYREIILDSISNMRKEFVLSNRNQILNLMRKLDNQQYDAKYRKAICHIDQFLNSELIPRY